jgi:hypothetical protein
VAMSFDPITATWTKFLHSEPICTSTRDAIETLLKESERKLAKLLSAGGNTVPFQGIMVQTLTLYRRQQRDPSSGDSVQSESVVVATPAPTLSDTVSGDFGHMEHLVEVATSREPSVDEAPVDKAPVEEAVVEDVNEKSLDEKPLYVSEEPGQASQESETISFKRSPWSMSKKDKKKKATFTFDEIKPAEEYLAEVPAEEPPAEDDFAWGSFTATKKDKKKGKTLIEEEKLSPPEPVPEPEDDFGWGSFSTSKKKKKGKTLIEEEKIPPHELEPVSHPVEEFEEPKLDEPLPAPSPPPLPPPSESRPRIEDGVLGTLRSEAPLLPECVGHPTSAPSLTAAAPIEIMTENL